MPLTPIQILQKYWGHTYFRNSQEAVIKNILDKKDSLVIFPTGGGKSICFQVPTLVMEGVCLVICPLVALMKDQVNNLNKKGIPSLMLNAGMTSREIIITLKNAVYGNYKFLYLSPERLQTNLFLEYLQQMNICLVAVDEAHCISEWGYDFRPSYLLINTIKEYLPETQFVALTASATKKVQDDIIEKLELKNPSIFCTSFERKNLSYSCINEINKVNKLVSILQKVQGSSIVYCKSRKRTQQISNILKLQNFNVDYYHAGLSNSEREEKQQQWIDEKIKTIVSTNAFGMGIDKANVRLVVHYDMPDCLEHYYQEAGRAGRDNQKAYAVLLFNENDILDLKNNIDVKYPTPENTKFIFSCLMNYLQVHVNEGEGQYFSFNLTTFLHNFKLNAFQVLAVFKILEQENHIIFSDGILKPSTIEILSTKTHLKFLEETQPENDEIIKALLRMYEGILDYPAIINEKSIAIFLNKNEEDIVKNLLTLHNQKVIFYTPQSDAQKIFFPNNRVKAADLFLNYKKIEARKKLYVEKLNKIIAYAKDNTNCRSASINNYFNDADTLTKCGICDNCISFTKNANNNLEELSKEMLLLIKEGNQSFITLQQKLSKYSSKNILKVFNQFVNEELILTDEHGIISLTS